MAVMTKSDKRFWMTMMGILVIAILLLASNHATAPQKDSQNAMTDATSTPVDTVATSTQVYDYSCDDDKSITATFHLPTDDFINVNLSDGRHLILAHVISADGARYANANESIVFWTRGVTAFVTDDGAMTYSNCVANRFP